MFLKKIPTKKYYNADKWILVIHCSICTGEQVAGFKNITTGKFEDIMLICTDDDLRKFKEEYCIDEIKKEY